ncbi:tRNA preQ1(34) S-adenosylmethionine ribosyltransferase-isomerase QueA [Candidatus Woesearchaeota archaeon]|jgi:S-adenosylmethionine:tRNA ribosyltransferase-isomerase|nr:tRNA preQ1(34) S-adenosylmethionine ribosyltransferase-isomerase QueA [Candidatus Woesearchaeota archaeon]MBT6518793.1 tRNA preQ1(34) S-adenosylmethionine ribosyltransferase-isomerase QueA [Candidatus Woesearchaeota archaeon]MBT7367932.1 tRNA preQ1(34) S-adenosylmethionine ribosyltransferase-isomerase QueA [Candidatus Woesearchaeota archaeon]
MNLNDFDYELPEEFIAQEPCKPRDHSKMMVVCGVDNTSKLNSNVEIEHKKFYELIDLLHKGDVLVLNETKVSRRKIFGKKSTGADLELVLGDKKTELVYECRIKVHRPRIGTKLVFEDGLSCVILEQKDDMFTVEFNKDPELVIEKIGVLPTPPYIKQNVDENDYQTSYSNAEKSKSLAAPTAGLHFTQEILNSLKKKGIRIVKICLHVDYGTFVSIRGKIEDHKMHSEWFEIDQNAADLINNCIGRLICVGTTTLRSLESANYDCAGKIMPTTKKTDIFIYPGYKFKSKTDLLLTNFHLPKSTLLLLVSAFSVREIILNAYEIAKEKKYRFFSLGDCMLISKQKK